MIGKRNKKFFVVYHPMIDQFCIFYDISNQRQENMEAYLAILLFVVICEIALLFFVYKKISRGKEKRKSLEEEQKMRETICFPSGGEQAPTNLEKKVNSLIKENPESAVLFIRKLIADDSTISKGNKKKSKEFSNLEKSAYIIRLLDSDLSAKIFKHLQQDEIITLASEITKLGLLDTKEQISILREFKDNMEKKL